ncbi:LLM class flavin-dependent oxidoreductase [Streptomyces aurantiacus]|uniref:FMNH2-utilizing oxygenase n=1 Tax=Streptomyces aurantiacus TaxID=47760 RepID=A0A7G1PD23_9ACTN|nr:LLM class flavin-dependent oxidoreductase [Streptomyces aurantiacus]BCL31667.1 FMNH2-utilizing oxygenase [Streptomyces aurantiacus]
MTAPHGRGLLHLAAAIDQEAAPDVSAYVELTRLAERGTFDFVTLGDTFARPGLDAFDVLARVAPATKRIGLVPTVTTPHTEPFHVQAAHVQAAVATLDRVSHGRAGWCIDVSTGRFVDRDKPHHVDFEGDTFSVRGTSTMPRPAQGYPVRVVDATDRHARATAARYADVALVRGANPAQVGAVRAELHAAALAQGRDPDELRVLAALTVDLGDGERAAERGHGGGGPRQTAQGPLYRGGPVDLAELIARWHETGAADGFHLIPVEPRRDLERLVNGTIALLQHRGLFRTFYPGGTLREHLGLARPARL